MGFLRWALTSKPSPVGEGGTRSVTDEAFLTQGGVNSKAPSGRTRSGTGLYEYYGILVGAIQESPAIQVAEDVAPYGLLRFHRGAGSFHRCAVPLPPGGRLLV